MMWIDALSEIFPESSEEYQAITTAYKFLNSPIPMTAAEAKTLLYQIDGVRSRLSTIYFLISRELSKAKSGIQSEYDAGYTRLVRQGRPSHTAIEAELRTLLPNYLIFSDTSEKYTQVKDLVASFIKGLDGIKQTTLEAFRDSRRID